MIFALLFAWFAYLDRLRDDGYFGMVAITFVELLLEIVGAIVIAHAALGSK